MPGGDDKRGRPVFVPIEGAMRPEDYPDYEEFDRLLREGPSAPEPPKLPEPPAPEPPAPPQSRQAPPVDAPDPRAGLAPPSRPEPAPAPPPESEPGAWPPPPTEGEFSLPAYLPVRRAPAPPIPLEPPPPPPAAEEEERRPPTATALDEQRRLAEENGRLRAELEELRKQAPAPGASLVPTAPGLPTPDSLAQLQPEGEVDWGAAGLAAGAAPGVPPLPLGRPRTPGTGIDLAGDIRQAQQRLYAGEAERDTALQREYGGALGQTGAGVHGLLRGATLGLSDPLIGGLTAAAVSALTDRTFSQAYADARADMAKMAEANPVTAIGTQLAGAVAPALLTGGTGVAGTAARLTPAGRAAMVGQRMAERAGIQTAARGAGPLGRALAGAATGAAGAATEGALGGLGAGFAEATLPENITSPARFAEELVKGAGSGALIGTAFGGVFGAGAGALRGQGKQLGEVAEAFGERPLPDVTPSDVPEAQLRETAEAMGQNRKAATDGQALVEEEQAATSLRRRAENVRMSEKGFKELVQRESRKLQQESKELKELIAVHNDRADIAAKRAASQFNESDEAAKLYEGKPRQQELDFAEPKIIDRPVSARASAEIDEALANVRTVIDDFLETQPATDPLKKNEVVFLAKLRTELDEAHKAITTELRAGKLGKAQKMYLEDVQEVLVKKLADKTVEGDPRLNALLTDLMRETRRVSPFADNQNAFEIPSYFPRSKEVQAAIDQQMGSLHGKLDGLATQFGEALKSDAPTFGIIKRLRDGFNNQHAKINELLAEGKVGDAYMAFDQGVKAAIGKEVNNARSEYVRKFLRELTKEPMYFLEGKNAAGNKVASVWDRYIDARGAVDRVLGRLGEMSKAGGFDGAQNVKNTIERVASRARRAKKDGAITVSKSQEYLEDLRKRVTMSFGNDRVWDKTKPGALEARRQLGEMLDDAQLWESYSLAERQVIGNKPWARSISTADDSHFSQFFSTGPERGGNEWDNLEQANSGAVTSLLENIGDASALRDEQAFRLNIRDIGADAEARQRAWGADGDKGRARSKRIVDLARTMEGRLDLAARARAQSIAGGNYLRGEPGLEALGGGLLGTVLGGGVTGGVAGAFVGAQTPKALRSLTRAVAESQAGTDSLISRMAKRVIKTSQGAVSAAEKGARVADAHGARIVGALSRLPNEREIEEKIAEARALGDPSSPEARAQLERAAELEQHDPEAARAQLQLEQRRAGLLRDKSPQDDRLDPSSARKLARTITAAYYPERTIRNLGDGAASHDEVEAFKLVFPELYATWEAAATAELSGKKLTRAQTLAAFRIAGIKTQEALDAKRLRSAQMWANPEPKPEQPRRGAVRSRVSQTYSTDPERYTTKSDRIMAQ